MITVLSALIRPCKQVESHMKFNVRNIIMCPLFLDSSPISRLQRVMLGKSTALRHVSPLTVDESWQRVAVSCLTGYFSKSVTGLSHTRRQLVTLCIFFRYDMRNLFYFLLDTYNNPPPQKKKKKEVLWDDTGNTWHSESHHQQTETEIHQSPLKWPISIWELLTILQSSMKDKKIFAAIDYVIRKYCIWNYSVFLQLDLMQYQ